ncbi:NAD-dependent dihydropyrimidine dehydrogenase, PreA subunit [Amycolatopsis rubida]|uniref:NAD-dependent dihydropyrimidine dehydrogenase, PreA subunit n=1 Tax=Amycolatopsis rubida TaxID=112413 RepID=A0A1I5V758_9PSEU|nr:NAD-dependent dihydropyrimidine dehydrogenase, PreA subunit [Amycolatopsis rubida]
MDECPVDCIYVGERSLCIHPDDCGACEPVCPVEAIYYEDDLPDRWRIHAEDNARFFSETLPRRDAPLDTPAGAAKLGDLGVDTPLVAEQPRPDIPAQRQCAPAGGPSRDAEVREGHPEGIRLARTYFHRSGVAPRTRRAAHCGENLIRLG